MGLVFLVIKVLSFNSECPVDGVLCQLISLSITAYLSPIFALVN